VTGRGVDQILPCPSAPEIHEPNVDDARVYVQLAEEASGPIPRAVAPEYIWGDALVELERLAPDARIINLETSVTGSDAYWPGKGINYRMHPANVACLSVARIDVCALANNHVLDYGEAGLAETLETLTAAGLKSAGAGRDLVGAQCPAIVGPLREARVIVFSFATTTSGVPRAWAAAEHQPGVDLLADLSDATAREIAERVQRVKRPGDVVVASIHWGSNWGYEVPSAHVRFAHALIDGAVDIVHGHSSHHPRPVEVHRRKLVLYGCGDLLDDYEGIPGYEAFRDDLVLLYFASVDSRTGELAGLRMTPMRISKMHLTRVVPADAAWLRDRLDEVSRPFGAGVQLTADGRLELHSAIGPRGAAEPWRARLVS
jgi:poly-gamma-glutamate synthesis protein (capsule biosynthesis protein)